MSTDNVVTVKAFGGMEVKGAATGDVEAIIATLNVVDRDHEVILPGAIKDGAKVKLSGYGHAAMYGDMPVGKGTLHTEGDKVIFKGRFFLSTIAGREAFETIKEIGTEGEWSFGFRVISAENAPEAWAKQGAYRMLKDLEPFEVSPVIIGAGIGTQTLAMKSQAADAEAKVLADEAARVAAEQAAAQAEADRIAAEEVAAKEAAAKSAAEQKAAVAQEFERFQRNLRKFRAA